MKKHSLLLSGSLLCLLIAGCTSVKRFRSATYESQDHTLVDMELFGTRLVPEGTGPAGRNLWDLSASAQTQLIQILNERYPDNGQFISSLANEYLEDEGLAPINLTRKELRMVFTVSKRRDYPALNHSASRFSPADRIEYLSFSLEIPRGYNLQFTGWNRFTTEYGEMEIADVSFSRSIDVDTDISLVSRADMGGKGSMGRNEAQELRARYLKLNGSISERRISVEEEGTREIDLTGNVIADVSLEFKGFPERVAIPLFVAEDQSAGGTPGLATLRFVDVMVPRMTEAPDTIKGILHLDYIYRHVQAGWKTFQEWDDQVEYYSGTVEKEVPLFTRSEYLPAFYFIGTDTGSEGILKIRSGSGIEYPLQFRNYRDAFRFLEWLAGTPAEGIGNSGTAGKDAADGIISFGTNTLIFQGEPMKAGEPASLGLKVMPAF